MKPSRLTSLVLVFAMFTGLITAAETPKSDSSQNAAEIESLKKQLAEQQKQIEELRMMILGQRKQNDTVASKEAPAAAERNQVASTAPYIPSTVLAKASPMPLTIPAQAGAPKPAAAPSNPCEATGEAKSPAF